MSLEWHQIDTQTGEITLPHTKTGRQIRTVGEAAMELLAGMPKVDGNSYVFASRGGAAVNYGRLRKSFADACKTAGVKDARLHDLRRTLATRAAASGIPVTVLRDLLNHSTLEMATRYARRADTELRQAQDEAAKRMEQMMRGADTNVVTLDRRTHS